METQTSKSRSTFYLWLASILLGIITLFPIGLITLIDATFGGAPQISNPLLLPPILLGILIVYAGLRQQFKNNTGKAIAICVLILVLLNLAGCAIVHDQLNRIH
jgi:uncharacterized BrkB/YihY/UPF0761 family membrane protein